MQQYPVRYFGSTDASDLPVQNLQWNHHQSSYQRIVLFPYLIPSSRCMWSSPLVHCALITQHVSALTCVAAVTSGIVFYFLLFCMATKCVFDMQARCSDLLVLRAHRQRTLSY